MIVDVWEPDEPWSMAASHRIDFLRKEIVNYSLTYPGEDFVHIRLEIWPETIKRGFRWRFLAFLRKGKKNGEILKFKIISWG